MTFVANYCSSYEIEQPCMMQCVGTVLGKKLRESFMVTQQFVYSDESHWIKSK